MNPAEADDLATRIANGWPGQPHIGHDTWAEELADLDYPRACTTLAKLRRELDRPPAIAAFIRRYGELHTATSHPHDYCENCQNTGWEEATRPQDTHTSVRPCRQCPRGQPMHATHAAILHANGHQRRGAA